MSMFRDLINQPFGSLKLESEDETELKVDDEVIISQKSDDGK